MQNIAITFSSLHLKSRALALAERLNISLTENNTPTSDWLLVVTENGLELQHTKNNHKLFINFLSGPLGFRLKHSRTKNELLAKAVGIKKDYKPFIIDTTGGLGRDAFILANLGCAVTVLERSTILSVLLEDALTRALNEQHYEFLNIELFNIDAIKFLSKLNSNEYPDVIYLDPMYPHRTKSALVKKEMRLLRDLVGDDQDADRLLAIALTKAKQRVVVKRPRLAETLMNKKPDFTVSGTSQRFDIYLTSILKIS